jgi:F0F1-type ATP synthase gamma subunit
MNLIDTFIEGLEEDTDIVDLKDILVKDDLNLWEKYVDIFDSIDIDDVLGSLKKISAKYKLSHNEEITMLAYVKFLEIMVMKASMVRGMDMEHKEEDTTKPKEPEGNMYG